MSLALAEKKPQVQGYKRQDVDPITFEVIRHRLLAITDEQAAALAAVSGSPLVNEATDFNTGLYRAHGEVVTMGRTVMFHAASCSEMVKYIIQDCADDPGIGPDDMFILNHPYKGALHAPDFGILAPIFVDGERIGWTGVAAHQLDVGGMVFGGFASHADDARQEGMLVPPVKIVDGGKLRTDVWAMITGMSRLPTNLSLDLKGMLAANHVGVRRLKETIEQYGRDTVLSVMDSVIELSEQKLRNRLRELPDGKFRAQRFLDHDGKQNKLYRIHVTLTKSGDNLSFDFSGSSPQAPGFVNTTRTGLLAGVYSALLPIVGYDIPWNDGLFRPVEVIGRSGSIVSAEFPAPVSQGPLGTMWLVEVTATEALSKLMAASPTFMREGQASPASGPDLFNVHGRNQYGEPATGVFLDQTMSGGGAYCHRDGITAQGQRNITAGKTPNVESLELLMPVLYLYRKVMKDSGGPGRNRGGLSAGAGYVIHGTDHLRVLVACHGYESPTSRGLFGGYPSGCNRRRLVQHTQVRKVLASGTMPSGVDGLEGVEIALSAKPPLFDFGQDDVYEWGPQAGGGWGDPIEREPERVVEDVKFDAVSKGAAHDIYGVVINADGTLDGAGTQALRDRIRKERLGWPQPKRMAEAVDASEAEVVVTYGDQADFVRVKGKLYFRCGCQQVIAPASENWKQFACQGVARAEQLGPRVALHEGLVATRYACPSCARLLDVDVRLTTDEPLFDVEIA
jgi:N-methylhydantoinase B